MVFLRAFAYTQVCIGKHKSSSFSVAQLGTRILRRPKMGLDIGPKKVMV
jgi:hypothetical protein